MQLAQHSYINSKVSTSTLLHDGVINGIERSKNIERQDYCAFTYISGYVYVAQHSKQRGLGRMSTR